MTERIRAGLWSLAGLLKGEEKRKMIRFGKMGDHVPAIIIGYMRMREIDAKQADRTAGQRVMQEVEKSR